MDLKATELETHTQYSTIAVFHHSIDRFKQIAEKSNVITINCRNSIIFIY